MVQYVNDNPCPHYNTVAASQATQNLCASASGGTTGKTGDYLESLTVIAGSTTPGVVTLFDGVTPVITTTVGTATVMPFMQTMPIRAFSKTGAWNVTTGAAVSVLAVGRFS